MTVIINKILDANSLSQSMMYTICHSMNTCMHGSQYYIGTRIRYNDSNNIRMTAEESQVTSFSLCKIRPTLRDKMPNSKHTHSELFQYNVQTSLKTITRDDNVN